MHHSQPLQPLLLQLSEQKMADGQGGVDGFVIIIYISNPQRTVLLFSLAQTGHDLSDLIQPTPMCLLFQQYLLTVFEDPNVTPESSIRLAEGDHDVRTVVFFLYKEI